MIDRTLAQHARTAPDVVHQHHRWPRPSGRVAHSSVGPNIAVTAHAERGGEVHRARVVRDERRGSWRARRRATRRSVRPMRSKSVDVCRRHELVAGRHDRRRSPTRTAATPSAARPSHDARRTTRPASAWRRRRRLQARRPRAASCRPSRASQQLGAGLPERRRDGDPRLERAALETRARASGADSTRPDAPRPGRATAVVSSGARRSVRYPQRTGMPARQAVNAE